MEEEEEEEKEEEEEEEEEYKGIQRKAKQQQTFWSFQGCLVTTANYLQGTIYRDLQEEEEEDNTELMVNRKNDL